jgi:hypothetical protein
MYIKFFANKSGGSKGSINYLLDEKRVSDGTAKVLKGNADFTKSIIGEIKNKHKVSWGSINLSEGETLTAAQKEKVMSDFEKTLCPGMSENQYNILWGELTEKGRLELNFVIPKIELTTQKAFNPYFHKVDFSRIDMFEDIQNIKYNLQSKKDPANAQTLQGEKKDINLVKDYQELDNTLHELVQDRQIQNREHLISLLNENNIKVTRTNKEGISIKLPDSKKAKRFKGSIYNEQFTSHEELKEYSEATDRRIKEFQSRDTSRELEQTIKRLDEYNEQKAQHNREKYQLKDDRYKRTEQEPIQSKSDDMDISINNDNRAVNGSAISRVHPEISRTDKVVNTKRDEIPTREREIHNKPRPTVQQRQNDSIHQDRGIDHDTRTATLRRTRARAKAQRESYAEARQSRVELHQAITEQSKELRAELEQNSIELSREYEPIVRTARATTEQSSNHIEAVKSIERATNTRELINIGVQQFIDKVREFGAGLKQRFGQLVQESGDISRTAKENLDYKEQREQSYNTPSYGMRM